MSIIILFLYNIEMKTKQCKTVLEALNDSPCIDNRAILHFDILYVMSLYLMGRVFSSHWPLFKLKFKKETRLSDNSCAAKPGQARAQHPESGKQYFGMDQGWVYILE